MKILARTLAIAITLVAATSANATLWFVGDKRCERLPGSSLNQEFEAVSNRWRGRLEVLAPPHRTADGISFFLVIAHDHSGAKIPFLVTNSLQYCKTAAEGKGTGEQVKDGKQKETGVLQNSQNKSEGSRKSDTLVYLPWTLDVSGFDSGRCEVTDLARNFKEARGWASESSGWITLHSIVETPEKITLSYYDRMVNAESVRTFYKDMATCKSFRR